MYKKFILTSVLSVLLSIILITPVFAEELLKKSNFDDGVALPWTEVETAPAHADFNVSGGKFNIKIINKGTNRWDVQFRHRGLTIEKGHTYNVQFTAETTADCKVYAKIGEMGPDANNKYLEYWHNSEKPEQLIDIVASKPLVVNQTFTMDQETSSKCEFTFHIAGECATAPLPYTISFSNIHVIDSQLSEKAGMSAAPTNAIRVNQIGYFTNLEKTATLVSASTKPVLWSLKDSTGKVVITGNSIVKGLDHASGDNVHIIDFSSFKTEGKGYILSVDNSAVDLALTKTADSMPFAISKDLYSQLKLSAINYFYQNRSGIDITMPYALQADLTRKAGINDSALTNVPGSSGTYTLNVAKGWFDAGDHGKYVVNGGISVWTLMNQYENAVYYGDVKSAPIADKTMNIPESGNGIPDILDESRWEQEMILGMQVPDGNTLSGMAHHSAHDVAWTGLATRPDQDSQKRYLYPPTTAATLNLAASAAQASRLWTKYDAAFSAKCLTAAEKAWKAALANPAIYAASGSVGGGDYGDNNVTDEFYWAACELYSTTGKSEYLDYIKKSPFYLKMPTILTNEEDLEMSGAFDWANISGLGTISLALTPRLKKADIATAKANIQKAADAFIAIENAEGYGSAISEGKLKVSTTGEVIKGYPWGSNSFIENEAIVMGYAYEFSKDVKYLNGVATAMDYLLGRNPNVISYITGYGTNSVKNPHHRFWAFQTDPTYPKAPPGCISGGPNSGLEDPLVIATGWKPGVRSAQKSYMDNIESWSTNEITINWNAPLAWITGFMDQQENQLNQSNKKSTLPIIFILGLAIGIGAILYITIKLTNSKKIKKGLRE